MPVTQDVLAERTIERAHPDQQPLSAPSDTLQATSTNVLENRTEGEISQSSSSSRDSKRSTGVQEDPDICALTLAVQSVHIKDRQAEPLTKTSATHSLSSSPQSSPNTEASRNSNAKASPNIQETAVSEDTEPPASYSSGSVKATKHVGPKKCKGRAFKQPLDNTTQPSNTPAHFRPVTRGQPKIEKEAAQRMIRSHLGLPKLTDN